MQRARGRVQPEEVRPVLSPKPPPSPREKLLTGLAEALAPVKKGVDPRHAEVTGLLSCLAENAARVVNGDGEVVRVRLELGHTTERGQEYRVAARVEETVCFLLQAFVPTSGYPAVIDGTLCRDEESVVAELLQISGRRTVQDALKALRNRVEVWSRRA